MGVVTASVGNSGLFRVSLKGGFFYCPDEAMDHRDRGHLVLEGGQRTRKVIDQRRSAIRPGPAGSDNGAYVAHGNVEGSGNPRLSPLTRIGFSPFLKFSKLPIF
jgi:hypothetical protein